MAKRHKMSRSSSRQNFSRGTRINKKNATGTPLRGGIRL